MFEKIILIVVLLGYCNSAHCAERPDRYEIGVTDEIVARSQKSMLSIRIHQKNKEQKNNLDSVADYPVKISFQAFDVAKGDVREISVTTSLESIEKLLDGGKETLKSGNIVAVVDQENRLLLSIETPENGIISILLEEVQLDRLKKWIVYCK